MQRCREIVDKCSKNFIDLGADNNPHYENEEGGNKEKSYKTLINNKKVLDTASSRFFKITGESNNNFECLGLPEPRINKFDTFMVNKLNTFSKYISFEIPENYIVDDIIVKVDRR